MNKPKVEMREISEAPNLQELKDIFGVDEKYLIIAYGDKIYVKGKELSPDLLVHELTHCERQGFNALDAKRWYEKYMRDKDFRLKEESVAYAGQFAYCKRVYKDRNKQAKILWMLAEHLAGSQYGNIISHSEAMNLIKNMV